MPSYSIEWPRRGAGERVLNLLFPPRCVCCGEWGTWLCDDCVSLIPSRNVQSCRRCGAALPAPGLCVPCQQTRSYLTSANWVSSHEAPLRRAVHALKYDSVRVLAGPLGQIMAQYWSRRSCGVAVVVPVPLHVSRVRRRGYNQAALLARVLGDALKLPCGEDLLVRTRRTPSQVGLDPRERWDNVRGAFRCIDHVRGDSPVLLVDDVMTTGATLEACAHALRERGAQEVHALTLTRVTGRRMAGVRLSRSAAVA